MLHAYADTLKNRYEFGEFDRVFGNVCMCVSEWARGLSMHFYWIIERIGLFCGSPAWKWLARARSNWKAIVTISHDCSSFVWKVIDNDWCCRMFFIPYHLILKCVKIPWKWNATNWRISIQLSLILSSLWLFPHYAFHTTTEPKKCVAFLIY